MCSAKRDPFPLMPFCKICGWCKGGQDSWDGKACKCGFVCLPNDYLTPIIRDLTYNMAVTLRNSHEFPDQGRVTGKRRIYTGLGKWTYIAALGVYRGLVKRGLAYPDGHEKDGYLTPIGLEVAEQVSLEWSRSGKAPYDWKL